MPRKCALVELDSLGDSAELKSRAVSTVARFLLWPDSVFGSAWPRGQASLRTVKAAFTFRWPAVCFWNGREIGPRRQILEESDWVPCVA